MEVDSLTKEQHGKLWRVGLVEKTKAQQQEIEQLKRQNTQWQKTCANLHVEYGDEIEQLKTQAAVKDTQLRIILENINKFPPEGTTIGKNLWVKSTKAALTNNCFYHNPADTELIDSLVADKDEQAGTIMRLEETLKRIATPLPYMQKEAETTGCVLDGIMAIELMKDPNYYRGIANKALYLLGGKKDEIHSND